MNIKDTIFDPSYSCRLRYKDHLFRCAEAAYQSQKCPSMIEAFTSLDADQARQLGKKVPLRGDWEGVRYSIMREIQRIKFIPEDFFRKDQTHFFFTKLDETHPEDLIYDVDDYYWGEINGSGQNNLGKILMEIREENHIPF